MKALLIADSQVIKDAKLVRTVDVLAYEYDSLFRRLIIIVKPHIAYVYDVSDLYSSYIVSIIAEAVTTGFYDFTQFDFVARIILSELEEE